MKLELAGIIEKPGSSVSFDYTMDCSDLEVNFVFPFPRPVRVCGEVRNDAGILTLECDVTGEMEFDCFRCTEHTVRDYFLPVDATVVTDADGAVELDGFLRDTMVLESDMLFLCRDDCKGICPTCGKNLNLGPCECRPEGDHRLDSLRELLERKRGEDAGE